MKTASLALFDQLSVDFTSWRNFQITVLILIKTLITVLILIKTLITVLILIKMLLLY